MTTASQLPLHDRGLAYGDGCFETLRLRQGASPLADLHRQRMMAGARRLGIPFDPAGLDQLLTSQSGDQVLKVILTRGSGGRGYRLPPQQQPRLIASLHPLPRWPNHWFDPGLKLALCQLRLAHQPALAGIKHLNRLEQVLARAEVDRHGLDEGLLLDQQGHVIELTGMNLFARFDDQWLTPSLDYCGVEGVMRRYLLERLAPQMGLSTRVTTMPLSHLAKAHEVFACNSVAGIFPVRSLGVWQWPVGDTTLALSAQTQSLWQ